MLKYKVAMIFCLYVVAGCRADPSANDAWQLLFQSSEVSSRASSEDSSNDSSQDSSDDSSEDSSESSSDSTSSSDDDASADLEEPVMMTPDSVATVEQVRAYIWQNQQSLELESARGHGTSITTLGQLAGCPDIARLGAFLQANFTSIFSSTSAPGAQTNVVDAIEHHLRHDLFCSNL